ncbi:hypothetical protein SAMN05880501_11747 [Ureibacillus xyleni]|uniref:Type III restriction/modification enzyme restriction subunit n=1 Tax=Ureibacillus xyleni TaxID=614648 RepID=A0A285TNV5_9BACL|nr:hypothetical protein [Ureibacillus xyleni]SOC24524.1 hypothetical protein SAMN05880501_11747 [Ureibacillus xyleni]
MEKLKATHQHNNSLVVNSSYFEQLKKQITDQSRWDSNIFHVFNHEAGTGKSQFTLAEIAELVVRTDYKVLYVQKFKRGDALIDTVKTINSHAVYSVAEYIDSKDNKDRNSKIKNEIRNRKLNAKVLAITHNMYMRVCFGKHQEILDGRHILIIDEFPDFLERVTISLKDLSKLWENAYRFKEKEFIEKLVTDLKNIVTQEITNPHNVRNFPYLDFSSKYFDPYKQSLPTIIENYQQLKETEVLSRILQILNNGCRYSNNDLHTFNSEIEPKLLKNNIILDANAGFDYRYELSNLFVVHPQDKFYDYSNSTLTHYCVKTSKEALSRNINFYQKALEKLSLSFKEKILFVTDKDNEDTLKKEIQNYLVLTGKTDKEIQKIEETITIEYFGNIIGVNDYREYETVVIMKTPNFDYVDYVLQHDYYKPLKHLNEDIPIFKDTTVEQIRKTMIAGEIYQAMKRINRDNSKNAHYIVFTANEDAIDIVRQQMPGINYYQYELNVDYTARKTEEETKTEKRQKKIMEFLYNCKQEGKEKVAKREIRDVIDYQDAKNFAKLLKSIEAFLISNQMYAKGQHVYIEQGEETEEKMAI